MQSHAFRMPSVFLVLVCSMLAFTAGATHAASAVSSRVTGSATYRERIALPANALFEARLVEISRADGSSLVIARTRLEHPGQVPIAFQIPYDRRRISSDGSYAVRATIRIGGHLRFATDQAYPVLTRGNGRTVRILLRSVARTPGEPDRGPRPRPLELGPLPATFTGLLPCADCSGIRVQLDLLPGGAYLQRMDYLRPGHDESFYELGAWSLENGRIELDRAVRDGSKYWEVVDRQTLRMLGRDGQPIVAGTPRELNRGAGVEPMEARFRLSGAFRSVADAPRFRDCRSGLDLPVAMREDYPALERAYAANRSQPGAELGVSLNARIEARPRMEGAGTELTLTVEKFLGTTPGVPCGPAGSPPGGARPGLENERWRPVQIGDRRVDVSNPQREPWMVLDPRELRVTGSGGCNRFSGAYEAGETTLRFGRMLSTQMACVSMDTETAFMRALEATRRYRVSGRTLELMDDRGRVLVRLEERNL